MAKQLYAGFSRLDITPSFGGVPLAGYGPTYLRRSRMILDRLYVNAVALGEDGEAKCVLLTMDLINMPFPYFFDYRTRVSEATGLPEHQIFIGGTHTHSAPDLHSQLDCMKDYKESFLPGKLVEAALRAIADLKKAKLSYGRTEVGHEGARLNFNRYYYMVHRSKLDSYTKEDLVEVGDNYNSYYVRNEGEWVYTGHLEEADHDMLVMRFSRENADDILLVNFAAHATITGGNEELNLSSDYPGAFRNEVESLYPELKCVFLQGCAGNQNTNTRIRTEGLPGLTWGSKRNHYAYAAVLAGHLRYLLRAGLQDAENESLAFGYESIMAPRDHSMDGRLEEAEKLAEIYLKEGVTKRVREMMEAAGFNSPYHCTAVIRKAKAPKESLIELYALRIGDAAIVFAPFELFYRTGKYIRDHSPFRMTFVKPYTCGSWMYLPTANTFQDSYEWNQTAFERGTAEKLEPVFERLLKELYEK